MIEKKKERPCILREIGYFILFNYLGHFLCLYYITPKGLKKNKREINALKRMKMNENALKTLRKIPYYPLGPSCLRSISPCDFPSPFVSLRSLYYNIKEEKGREGDIIR